MGAKKGRGPKNLHPERRGVGVTGWLFKGARAVVGNVNHEDLLVSFGPSP